MVDSVKIEYLKKNLTQPTINGFGFRSDMVTSVVSFSPFGRVVSCRVRASLYDTKYLVPGYQVYILVGVSRTSALGVGARKKRLPGVGR